MRTLLLILTLFSFSCGAQPGDQEAVSQDQGEYRLQKHADGRLEFTPLDEPFEEYRTDAEFVLSGREVWTLPKTWNEPHEIQVDFAKNHRHQSLLLPAGYRVGFGGWPDNSTPGQRYGINVGLFGSDGELINVVAASTFIRNDRETLSVQLTDDEIRVYLMRENGQYLHGDRSLRAEPGPCIIHEVVEPIYEGEYTLRGDRSGQSYRIFEVRVGPPHERPGERFKDVAEPVPNLAEHGLALPTVAGPFEHIGFAFRGDPGLPVDDPELARFVSIVPFGPPVNIEGPQKLHYRVDSFWVADEYAVWIEHCHAEGIDPEEGIIYAAADAEDIGRWKNLAFDPLRKWIKFHCERVAQKPGFDGIFWDVVYSEEKPPTLTRDEWSDLQGTLYREVWKESLQPRGKWPMINVAAAKAPENARIYQWIPIVYLDRQMGGDWVWHEQTVITNPKHRQELLGDEWISVMDSLGGDHHCLNENIKYGWLTQYYQRIATLGAFDGRHFLGGGFNGDTKGGGGSGRRDWRERHYVPASSFNVGNPTAEVEIVDDQTDNGNLTKLYRAEFQNATALHFPFYRDRFTAVDGPPYVLQFEAPHDVLQFDGTWLKRQTSVAIPAGSGRIVRPSD